MTTIPGAYVCLNHELSRTLGTGKTAPVVPLCARAHGGVGTNSESSADARLIAVCGATCVALIGSE
jgi:hypothetical protein